MTEIKKGDWVYINSTYIKKHVFQCASITSTGNIHDESTNTLWDRESCHRLTPLEPSEVKVGDLVVILDQNFKEGEIGEITEASNMYSISVDGIWLFDYRQLARLPDCAQRAPGAPDPDVGTEQKVEIDSDTTWTLPAPCPHPEWEGVWLYCGEAHRIEWDGTGFMAHEINTPDMDVFCLCPDTEWYSDGPTPRWTQLEPAPTASTAGPKLPRPQKHGAPTVPWDPYGEG